MRHAIAKFNKFDYIVDDCGAVYKVNKVGHKYYHLACVAGNGLSGEYNIDDIDCEFRVDYAQH